MVNVLVRGSVTQGVSEERPIRMERDGSAGVLSRRETTEADESTLVAAVQQGDEASFSELVRRYADRAFALALSITGGHHDAEDAVQSAFIRSLERIDQLRPGSPFGPWFYQVLRSTCLNLRRREKLRSHDPLPVGASSDSDPEERLDRSLLRERLLAALDRLPEMQRTAVILFDLEGYAHAEIAGILGIAVGTSRAHLHHGRRALREILGEEGATPGPVSGVQGVDSETGGASALSGGNDDE